MKVYTSEALTMPYLKDGLLDDIIGGKAKVMWHGNEMVGRLGATQQRALDAAMAAGYLVTGQTKADARLRSAFFHRCENAVYPYVIVKRRQKYAAVEMDMISCRRLTEEQAKKAGLIMKGAAAEGCRLGYGSTLVWADKVPVDKAEAVAIALRDLWHETEAGQHDD